MELEQLQQLLPKNKNVEEWYEALAEVLPYYGIDTPERMAAFIAQCSHESGGFSVLKENLNYRAETLRKVFPKYFPTDDVAKSYASKSNKQEMIANKVYANRMGNGPEDSGDGFKYCGRGLIQLTGKNNYQAFADSVEMDIDEVPEYLSTFEGAVKSACWFWETNNLNKWADAGDIFNLTKPITFYLSFCSDDIFCDYKKYDDTYSIFSIPGLDLNINFNSYSKYNFEIYDRKENVIYINSELKPNYKTTICVTINPIKKTIKMYQDGTLIGEKEYDEELFDYENVRKFYLGVGDYRRKETPKYFKGLINSFAVFDKELTQKEIETISENKNFGLTQNFKGYTSSNNLILYYDSKFIKNYKLTDLSGNDNHGKIVNCEIVEYDFDKIKLTHIPFRRDCSFKLLKHDENGFVNGSWKDQTTRYNQMKYYNEVLRGHKNIKDDGLSNCTYKEHSYSHVDNQKHIVVGI